MKARTSQQNSIYQVLDELGRPAPAKVIWELASDIVPGLGLATVYRALKALSTEGKIRKIEVEGLPARMPWRIQQASTAWFCYE